jgi:penicillin-binding protein 1C
MPARLLAAGLVAATIASAAAAGPQQLPSARQVRASYRASDAVLLDRHGEALQSLRLDMRGRRQPWTALADISPALPLAVLQAEDQRFMQHDGVDLKAMTQAAWDNLFRQRPRGASTITMQLAAQLDPALQPASAQGRSWSQKWQQAQAARALDAQWSKADILEAYLNLVSFRGELQGVGAAAHGMFGKAPSGLTVTESVILAALLRGPNAAPAAVGRRACALALELHADSSCRDIQYEVTRVLARAATQPQAALASQVAQQVLREPGSRQRSTLDAPLQRYAQSMLMQQLATLRERNVNDGALVVLDNASGEILAYVGNAGGSEVDGVQALRQAGSTLKPFLYQLALERNLLTAASLMDDSPVDIPTASGLYIPQNYDKEFKGYVSVRTSLASSLNVPAVRTLLMTGQERFHARLRALGFDSLTESADYYGPSLALGSAEVNLLALANAYRTLANGGLQGAVTLKLDDSSRPLPRRVADARAAFIIGDILADRAARSTTFGLSNDLATSYWAAVKTGTSKDMRDNWCVGYSTRFTVAAWVGNFNGGPMWDVSGVTGAAPVWRDVMDYLQRAAPGRAPTAPAGVRQQQVSYRPALEPVRLEWFIAGTETAEVQLLGEVGRVPRIVYPVDTSILALDPDIPSARQRVIFQAQTARGLRWRLDGADLGPAEQGVPWLPLAGGHALALVDAEGGTVTEVRFQVRGGAKP